MSLGSRIREMRKHNHLTQADLAKQINTSGTCISKYELGETTPNPDTLCLLAAALGTTADYLLGVSEPPVLTKMRTSPAFQQLVDLTADFSEKETQKLLEHAELLKKSR